MNSPYHSKELRKYFNISPFGIDWYNPFDIAIEFKETFSIKDISKIVIKISNKQLINSRFIVVCYNHSEFYIHKTELLKQKYKQNNDSNLTSIKLNSLRKNYLFKTDNYESLQKYLLNLK